RRSSYRSLLHYYYFFSSYNDQIHLHSFPTRRSSDLDRSGCPAGRRLHPGSARLHQRLRQKARAQAAPVTAVDHQRHELHEDDGIGAGQHEGAEADVLALVEVLQLYLAGHHEALEVALYRIHAGITGFRLGGGTATDRHVTVVIHRHYIKDTVAPLIIPVVQQRLDERACGVRPADVELVWVGPRDRLGATVADVRAAGLQGRQLLLDFRPMSHQPVGDRFQLAIAQAEQAEGLQDQVTVIALAVGQYEVLFHVGADAAAAVANGDTVLMGLLVAHRQLLQSTADHQQVVVALLEVADHLAELIRCIAHRLTRFPGLLLHLAGLLFGTAHGAEHLLHQLADLVSGGTHLNRQVAYFIGHHGEAAALLTGTGRLDRGIQGQHVGLCGKVLHRAENLADLPRGSLQCLHAALETIHDAADLLHVPAGLGQLNLRGAGGVQVA